MTGARPASGAGAEKRLLGGLAGQLGVTALSIGQQILLVPLFLSSWSAAEYASWIVLFSLSALLTIADFGLHPLSINRYQVSLALPKRRASVSLSRDVSDIANSYLINTALLIICLALAASFADPVARLNLAGADRAVLLSAFVMAAGLGITGILISGCSAIYRAHLEVSRLMMLRVAMLMAQIVGQVAVLLSGASVLAMASVLLAVNLAALMFMWAIEIPRFTNIRLGKRRLWSWRRHIETSRDAARFIVPGAADPLLNQGPVLILGLVDQNPLTIVLFNLCRVIASVPRMLAQQLCGLLGPEIGAAHARADLRGTRTSLRIALIVPSVITGVFLGSMVSLAQPLFAAWTKGTVPFDPWTLWLMFAALAVSPHTYAAVSALLYSNQPKPVTQLQLVRMAATTVLVAIGGWRFGAIGAAAALLAVEFASSAVPLAFALVGRFPVSWNELTAWSAAPLAAALVAFAGLSIAMAATLDLRTVLGLVIAVATIGAAAALLGLFAFRRAVRS